MKTEVMRERIRDINPEIVVKTYETFVLPDNVENCLKKLRIISLMPSIR